MKEKVLILYCLILALQLPAQQVHTSTISTTAPWTYWWWQGSAVDKAGITWQLEHFKKSGLGGAHIIPIYGVKGEESHFLPFLGEGWLEIFNFTCSEARRLGLGIDLSTGTGWPFGGPGVTPQNGAKQIVFNEVNASDTLKIKNLLQESSVAEATAFIINGDGNYNVVKNIGAASRLQHSPDQKYLIISYEPTNQLVKRAAPGGEGLVVDHFDQQAMKQYLAVFDTSLLVIKNNHLPRAMYNDSYEVFKANWTPVFFDAFKNQHHYDLKEVIYAVSPGYPDCQLKEKVMSDYRETLSSMLYETESTWTTWAKNHQMITRYQAHGAPGNLLDLYALADIPETESFGSSSFPIPGVRTDTDYEEKNFGRPHPLMMKFASSPAHLLGKKLVASESTTWLGNHFKVALSQIKPQIDELFTAGINHVFFHGTTYTPPNEPFPGWLFYTSTNYGIHSHFYNEFPLLNSYITNCQKLLQNSEADNDLLVYLPIYDFWANTKEPLLTLFSVHYAGKWFLNTPFGALSTQLWENGYAFDYISDRQIGQLKVNPDKSISINKSHYQSVLIPKISLIPVETLKSLAILAQQGVKIIFDQQLPTELPGKGRSADQDQFNELKKELTNNRSVTIGDALLALNQLNIRHESLNLSGLSFIRKQTANNKYWFITNLSNKFYRDTISLSEKAEALEYYNPMNGERGFIDFEKKNRGIGTTLSLPPGSSCFLIAYNHPQKGNSFQFKIASDEIATVKKSQTEDEYRHGYSMRPLKNKLYTHESLEISNWKVQFEHGSPAVPKMTFHPRELTSWTTWSDPALQWFNGYGTYSSDFKLPSNWKSNKGIYIRIDDLRETAKVTINGLVIGTIWAVPFEIFVPEKSLKFDQNNTIQLDVRNLSANEARYLDTKGVNWKKFYDANIVDITYRPFDASKWEPVPSGIIGKVRVVAVK